MVPLWVLQDPKSHSLTAPSMAIKKFSGLMSRWAMGGDWLCKWTRAWATSLVHCSINFSGILGRCAGKRGGVTTHNGLPLTRYRPQATPRQAQAIHNTHTLLRTYINPTSSMAQDTLSLVDVRWKALQ